MDLLCGSITYMLNKIKLILPYLLSEITGKPRARVDNLKWSKDIWVRNIFRLWELIFWRRAVQDPKTGKVTHEIRAECSAECSIIKGKVYYNQNFYTWESSLGYVEICIRRFFSKIFSLDFNVQKIQLAQVFAITLLGFELKFTENSFLFPFVVGAIAFDSAGQNSASGQATSYSYSFTNTAGDYMLAALGSNGAPATASYNSVSMGTKITNNATTGGNIFTCWLWGLIAPATGANTLAFTKASSGSNDCYSGVVSYSGTNQSAQPDAFNNRYAANGTTQAMAVTVVAANCWLSGWGLDDGGSSDWTTGTGFTARGTSPGTVSQFLDSNGTVSTGSQNINWKTTGNLQFVGLGVSIAPAGATATFIPKIMMS